MKTFWKGALVGGGVTAAAMFGYVVGTSAHAQQGATPKTTCDIEVGYGELTAGTQCNFNQVMVGTENGDLLCASLTTNCF